MFCDCRLGKPVHRSVNRRKERSGRRTRMPWRKKGGKMERSPMVVRRSRSWPRGSELVHLDLEKVPSRPGKFCECERPRRISLHALVDAGHARRLNVLNNGQDSCAVPQPPMAVCFGNRRLFAGPEFCILAAQCSFPRYSGIYHPICYVESDAVNLRLTRDSGGEMKSVAVHVTATLLHPRQPSALS